MAGNVLLDVCYKEKRFIRLKKYVDTTKQQFKGTQSSKLRNILSSSESTVYTVLGISFIFLHICHLNDSNQQTNVILHKDSLSKYKMQLLKDDFIIKGK